MHYESFVFDLQNAMRLSAIRGIRKRTGNGGRVRNMWRYDGIRAGQGATLVESRQTAYDANPIVKAAPVKYIQYRAKNLLKEHQFISIRHMMLDLKNCCC